MTTPLTNVFQKMYSPAKRREDADSTMEASFRLARRCLCLVEPASELGKCTKQPTRGDVLRM